MIHIRCAAAVVCLVAATGCGPEEKTSASDEASVAPVESRELGASFAPLGVGAREKPTIVLVHGAWADAHSWEKVIRILDAWGYRVTAVENTLSSLESDVEATRRVLAAETATRPVLVVAHSYGGAVITEAANDNPQVRGLIYIDAFVPDVGEPVGALAALNPSPLGAALVPDRYGYLTIDRERFRDVFCSDLSAAESMVLGVTQKPTAAGVFATPIDRAAWKTIPSWYLVGTEDNAIPVATQRFMASRMNAHVREVRASHASYVSQPLVVASVIAEAAAATSH